jgi:hypothetical protein
MDNEFIINELALKIAQLEVEKAFLKSKNQELKAKLQEKEKDNEVKA